MPRAKKTVIHVNQHRIKANAIHGTREPVITVKSGKVNRYGHEAIIRDAEGREVARVVYRPDKPLSCGARVWIESKLAVEVVVNKPEESKCLVPGCKDKATFKGNCAKHAARMLRSFKYATCPAGN